VIRLSRLASSGRTGALRLSGDLGGAIYLRHGEVVYAKSRRTPGLPALLAPPPGHPGQGEAAVPSGSLEWSLAVREATADAALDLLAGASPVPPRLRFQVSATPGFDPADSMSVEALTVELARRQDIMEQLSSVLTPDSEVIRCPHMTSHAVRVSAGQWALLIRAGDRFTPRSLAAELGRSVFETTIEAAHLISLQLLSVINAAAPLAAQAGHRSPGHGPPAVSFLRAVTQGRV
jgi:hypothetical protein